MKKNVIKKYLLGITIALFVSLVCFCSVSNNMWNNQDLQVRNEVYVLEREEIENIYPAYNVTINYPQFKRVITLDTGLDSVNSLLKDAAFSMYGKIYAEAITVLEEELRDSYSFEGTHIDYDILQLTNDYISLVFSIDCCVGGPSYIHQYLVTIDIKKGEYIYFNDMADINEVLEVLQSGNFEIYAGTYSEFSDEDAHASDVISCFVETFKEQISTSTTEGNFDRFSSQNIGLDQKYLYIYFPFEEGYSFHGYYILCVPLNLLA